MRWQQRINYIEDENSNLVCILPDNSDSKTIQTILKAPKMLEAISEFIEETDGGSMPAKKMYNRFKNIVEDIVD